MSFPNADYYPDFDGLNDNERELFNDKAIEAAYRAWFDSLMDSGQPAVSTRKAFLMRVRALIQQGKI